LEKAIAKLTGNYDLLTSGNSVDALFALTGAPSFSYLNSSKTPAAILTDLTNFTKLNYFMSASV